MAEADPVLPEPEQDSTLDQKYGSIIQSEKKQAPIRSSFDVAQETDPKKAGDIITLSKRTNLDRDTVRDDFDNIKKTVAQPTDKEYQSLLTNAPKVSKWLEDPYNAAATKNDRPHLEKLEQSLAESDPLARVQTDEEVVRRAEEAALRRYDELVAEEGKSFISPLEGDLVNNLVRTPAERAKLKLTLIAEEIGRRREIERFIANPNKVQAFEGRPSTDQGDMGDVFKGIPFLSMVPRILDAQDKARREARMSPEDQDILIQQQRIEAAMARRGTTIGAKAENFAAGMSEFIGEMSLPIGKATKAATIGSGFLSKMFTKGIDIAAQTALTQFPHVIANTIANGTAKSSVTQNANGELQLNVEGGGQTYALPFVKAVSSSLIDVGAANLPFHPAFKFWNKTTKTLPTVENFLKVYAKGGAEAIIGGIGISDATKLAKELMGLAGPVEVPTSIKALMGDKEAMQEVGVSAAGFGLTGVAGAALQRRRAQAEIVHGQAISYKDWFKDMSATVKEMESHGSHPEVVADGIKSMVQDTDKDFTKVPLSVFVDHYSKLGINPDEFAAGLTGNPKAVESAKTTGILSIPTEQYLTKIGATEAGPIFEKAGASFDANIPAVEAAKQHLDSLVKEQEAAKGKSITVDDQKFQDQIKSLGESFQVRAQEHGVDLAKFVEQNDAVKARKATGALTASTEIVNAAKEDLGQSKPLLADVPNLAMSPKDQEAYNNLRKDSIAAAYESVDADALGELNRDRKKQYDFIEGQVRSGMEKEVAKQPEYQAQSIMETGLDADGNIVHEGGLKLDRESLKETHNESSIEGLPRKVIATAKEAGVTADQAAEILGFSSGDELVRRLSNLESMDAAIDRRTAEVMAKMRLSELAELPEKAKEAIHNDQEAKVKAFQIKWLLEHRLPQMKDLILKKRTQKQYLEETKALAEKTVAENTDRRNSPSDYEAAERNWNRQAREALLAGDLENAVKYMDLELLNHELYRASQQGRKDARRIRDYASEFTKSDKRRQLYAAGKEYLGQSDQLLERFSFKNRSEAKVEALESLKEFAEREANEGRIIQIPEKLLKESYRESWRDVPLQDLRALERILKGLENNATLKNSILEGNVLKSRDAAAAEMAKQISISRLGQPIAKLYSNDALRIAIGGDAKDFGAEIVKQVKSGKIDATIKDLGLSSEVMKQIDGIKESIRKPIDSYTKTQEFWRGVKSLFLSGRADADIYREMDSHQDGGPMQQHILRRLNESGTKEAQLNERAMYALDGIYGKFSALERLKMNREAYIPEVNGSLSKWQRMEIAALIGQEGARQRFQDGRGWGEVQIKAITDGLTVKEWQWVKEVHAFLKTLEPEVREQIERRTGLPAEMVKPEAIDTPFGKQDGGYFPFKYDARTDPNTGKALDMEEARRAMQSAAVQSQTRHGFTEQRAARVEGKRLRFDAGVLFEHIREVNHDLAWSETLRDLNSLLNHKDVKGAINDHYGDQVYRQLTNSLHDIAVGDSGPQKAYDRYVNALRRGTTTANLGLSFMQAITDPIGITQGAARIGEKWMGVGMKKVLGDAVHMENAYKEMMDVSEQQRLRSKTFMREINEVRNKVEQQGKAAMWADMGLEKLTGGKIDVQDLHNGLYYMMTKVQIAQEGPLWWGALEKAKAEKPLAADATLEQSKAQHDTWVSMADQAVLDTYGGGQIKDLAPIQKGGSLSKLLFSTFYSFASRTFNLATNAGMKFARGPKNARSFGRLIGDMALLYAIPSFANFAIKSIAHEDDKDLGKKLVQDQLGYMAASVPYVREFAPTVKGQDYQGPAGLRLMVSAAKVGKAAWEGNADWRDLNASGGILFHYPALQVERFVRGMESWLDKGHGSPISPLVGPPRKKR